MRAEDKPDIKVAFLTEFCTAKRPIPADQLGNLVEINPNECPLMMLSKADEAAFSRSPITSLRFPGTDMLQQLGPVHADRGVSGSPGAGSG